MGWARRVPLTVSLTVLVLAMWVATGWLWDQLASRPLIEVFGYGLPSFEQGRPWTVLTGFPIALEPAQYVVIVLGLVAVGGFAEWRLGLRRTLVALVVLSTSGCWPIWSTPTPLLAGCFWARCCWAADPD